MYANRFVSKEYACENFLKRLQILTGFFLPRDKCLVSPEAMIKLRLPFKLYRTTKQWIYSSIIIYLNYFRFVFVKFKENNRQHMRFW